VNLPEPLIKGVLLKRYQRFLADVKLADGRVVTAHTPNTGSMQQCAIPGFEVLLSVSDNPQRKLPFTLELILVSGNWVDTNTQRANRVVGEGLANGTIPGLSGFTIVPEVRFGASRLDFKLERSGEKVLLEVKNVTLVDAAGRACFPDAVTTRGQKHLHELMAAAEQGWRTVILFLVQRREVEAFAPADHIDPIYGRLLRRAIASGVEALAVRTRVTETAVTIDKVIPVEVG